MYTPTALVVAHSKSSVTGREIVTFEIEMWRGVLAEFNTHNALSKNTSSSRAIPVDTMLKQVWEEPAGPVRFGAANKGMQDTGVNHTTEICFDDTDEEGNQICLPPAEAWAYSVGKAADISQAWHDAGYAKQICNRLNEIGQRVKLVVTATDLANFFWLRDHHMADPSIEAVAKAMKKAYLDSDAVCLTPGDWHVPYFGHGYWLKGCGVALESALAISASCCAQASYRKLDDTLEKAKGVVSRLNLGVDLTEPCHASPTEHQGTPIKKFEWYIQDVSIDSNEPPAVHVNNPAFPDTWQKGITHVTREGVFGSGNLKDFIQYRQLIPGNTYTGEIK